MEWCDHCDMPLQFCQHGSPSRSPHPDSSDRQWRARGQDCTEGEDGPTIEAREHGECGSCDGAIAPGDWIRHTRDGWVHSPPRETSSGRPPETDASMFEGMD